MLGYRCLGLGFFLVLKFLIGILGTGEYFLGSDFWVREGTWV